MQHQRDYHIKGIIIKGIIIKGIIIKGIINIKGIIIIKRIVTSKNLNSYIKVPPRTGVTRQSSFKHQITNIKQLKQLLHQSAATIRHIKGYPHTTDIWVI